MLWRHTIKKSAYHIALQSYRSVRSFIVWLNSFGQQKKGEICIHRVTKPPNLEFLVVFHLKYLHEVKYQSAWHIIFFLWLCLTVPLKFIVYLKQWERRDAYIQWVTKMLLNYPWHLTQAWSNLIHKPQYYAIKMPSNSWWCFNTRLKMSQSDLSLGKQLAVIMDHTRLRAHYKLHYCDGDLVICKLVGDTLDEYVFSSQHTYYWIILMSATYSKLVLLQELW